MALAFRVDGPSDLPRLLAAHDEYSSVVNDLFGRIVTPSDDYYTAPFCFMPDTSSDDDGGDGNNNGSRDGGGRRRRRRGGGGYVIMTCRVPYLHGHGAGQHGERHFHKAREIVREYCKNDDDGVGCPEDVPFLEMGPERLQEQLGLDEDEIYTFTDDGGYPDMDDIGLALEDRAVEITCRAMGWDVPRNWREERSEQLRLRCVEGIFDLAGWDRDRGGTTIVDGGAENSSDAEGSANKKMRYTMERALPALSLHGGGGGREDRDEKKSGHDGCDDDAEHDDRNVINANHPIVDRYGTLIPIVSGENRSQSQSEGQHDSFLHDGRQQQHSHEQCYDEDDDDSLQAECEEFEQRNQSFDDSFYDDNNNDGPNASHDANCDSTEDCTDSFCGDTDEDMTDTDDNNEGGGTRVLRLEGFSPRVLDDDGGRRRVRRVYDGSNDVNVIDENEGSGGRRQYEI